jgi:hypothetical protein
MDGNYGADPAQRAHVSRDTNGGSGGHVVAPLPVDGAVQSRSHVGQLVLTVSVVPPTAPRTLNNPSVSTRTTSRWSTRLRLPDFFMVCSIGAPCAIASHRDLHPKHVPLYRLRDVPYDCLRSTGLLPCCQGSPPFPGSGLPVSPWQKT